MRLLFFSWIFKHLPPTKMWAPNSLAHLWSSFSDVASTCTYQKHPSAEKGGKTQSCLCMCSLGTQSTSSHAHHSMSEFSARLKFLTIPTPCGMGRRIRRRSWTCKILCAPRLIVTNQNPNDLQLLSFLMQGKLKQAQQVFSIWGLCDLLCSDSPINHQNSPDHL